MIRLLVIDLVVGLVIFKLACYRESFIRRPRLPAIGRSGRHLVQREASGVSWPPPGHQQLVVVARCQGHQIAYTWLGSQYLSTGVLHVLVGKLVCNLVPQ